MKAMISQPMAGKTDDEIVKTRIKAVKVLENAGYEVVDTLFVDEFYSDKNLIEKGIKQIPLYFIAKSLEKMSECHAVYFCNGWYEARRCMLELEAAVKYGLKIIYEE